MKTLQESFDYLESRKSFTLNELLYEFRDVGLSFFGLLLVIPSSIPLPATYYSTPIGFIIFLIGINFVINKNILPKNYLNKKINVSKVKRFHKKISKIILFFDNISKKRMRYFFKNYLIGLVIIFLSLIMMIPYPLTDTLPAIALLFIFFSIINEDGLFFLFGIIIGIFASFIAYFAINYGYMFVKEMIYNLL